MGEGKGKERTGFSGKIMNSYKIKRAVQQVQYNGRGTSLSM